MDFKKLTNFLVPPLIGLAAYLTYRLVIVNWYIRFIAAREADPSDVTPGPLLIWLSAPAFAIFFTGAVIFFLSIISSIFQERTIKAFLTNFSFAILVFILLYGLFPVKFFPASSKDTKITKTPSFEHVEPKSFEELSEVCFRPLVPDDINFRTPTKIAWRKYPSCSFQEVTITFNNKNDLTELEIYEKQAGAKDKIATENLKSIDGKEVHLDFILAQDEGKWARRYEFVEDGVYVEVKWYDFRSNRTESDIEGLITSMEQI